MKLAALLSGGKDSMYAAYLAAQNHKIACILSVRSQNPDSYMFHVPNVHLVELQAQAMHVPLEVVFTKGEKEAELHDLKAGLRKVKEKYDISGITTGAVASQYQKSRIDILCEEMHLQSLAPLWQKNQKELLEQMLDSGFEIIITAVAAEGLDERWLGRKLDKGAFQDIINLNKKYGVSIVGEGGEFETLVLNCPLFTKHLKITEAEKLWDAKTRSGMLVVKRAELA